MSSEYIIRRDSKESLMKRSIVLFHKRRKGKAKKGKDSGGGEAKGSQAIVGVEIGTRRSRSGFAEARGRRKNSRVLVVEYLLIERASRAS